MQSAGFLKEENRINVAVTRAKSRLWVYGNKAMILAMDLSAELHRHMQEQIAKGLHGYLVRLCNSSSQ